MFDDERLTFFTLHCYCCWLNSTNKKYVQGFHVVHNICLYYSINNRVNLKIKWNWGPTVSLLGNSTNIYILHGKLVSNQPQNSNKYFQNQFTWINQNAPFPHKKSWKFALKAPRGWSVGGSKVAAHLQQQQLLLTINNSNNAK